MSNQIDFPVVTIDGPGGAGKGTLCMLLATKLGWHLLDSGAIYRVLAVAANKREIALNISSRNMVKNSWSKSSKTSHCICKKAIKSLL